MVNKKLILKIILAVSLLLFSNIKAANPSADKSPVLSWYDSYQTAYNISNYNKLQLVIDFNASLFCLCEKLDKEVLSDPEIKQQLSRFVCVKVDVDKNREIAYAFGVTSLPRIIVVNTHSEIVGDWLGYREKSDISTLLDDVLVYAYEKTGAIKAPDIKIAKSQEKRLTVDITLNLSARQQVINQLGAKNPAVRKEVIKQLTVHPKEAIEIAKAGLQSNYLGTRIASWKLYNLLRQSNSIKYDPWASTEERAKSLKSLSAKTNENQHPKADSVGKSSDSSN